MITEELRRAAQLLRAEAAKVKTEAQRQASRENGKKGGRPPKQKHQAPESENR